MYLGLHYLQWMDMMQIKEAHNYLDSFLLIANYDEYDLMEQRNYT